MDVNHALKLKCVADRAGLGRLLEVRLAGTGLSAAVLDGPGEPDRLPLWTSVIFTAHQGAWEEHMAQLGGTLERVGLANLFGPWQ